MSDESIVLYGNISKLVCYGSSVTGKSVKTYNLVFSFIYCFLLLSLCLLYFVLPYGVIKIDWCIDAITKRQKKNKKKHSKRVFIR